MPLLRLFEYEELLARGESPRTLREAGSTRRLVRVRQGLYADGQAWDAARPEDRIIARARAVQARSHARIVASHETAAALHGLGLYRPSPTHIHTIAPVGRPGGLVGVVRHRGDLADEDIVEIHGIRCTNLVRTVADMARTAAFDQAVVAADAALRRLCITATGAYDLGRARDFRRGARAIAARSAHGLTRAERVLAFADGRAQLPGESVSRVRLAELGFTRLTLQRPVRGPRGADYFVDFSLDDVPALGEFDGAIKYVDGRMLDGRTSAEVFDREKQREDWIRGTTGLPLVRWGWPHIASSEALAGRLAAFGIRARL